MIANLFWAGNCIIEEEYITTVVLIQEFITSTSNRRGSIESGTKSAFTTAMSINIPQPLPVGHQHHMPSHTQVPVICHQTSNHRRLHIILHATLRGTCYGAQRCALSTWLDLILHCSILFEFRDGVVWHFCLAENFYFKFWILCILCLCYYVRRGTYRGGRRCRHQEGGGVVSTKVTYNKISDLWISDIYNRNSVDGFDIYMMWIMIEYVHKVNSAVFRTY